MRNTTVRTIKRLSIRWKRISEREKEKRKKKCNDVVGDDDVNIWVWSNDEDDSNLEYNRDIVPRNIITEDNAVDTSCVGP